MKKFLVILFTAGTLSVQAQHASLAFSLGLPQNDFKENTDATGFGLDLSVAFPFQQGVPVYAGIDFNYMIYGLNAQNLDLAAEVRGLVVIFLLPFQFH